MRHFEEQVIATRYANYRPQVQSDIIAAIAMRLDWQHPFSRVVDYACGTGHSSAPLQPWAQELIGCDISLEMLKEARQHYPTIHFQHIDDGVMPFADNSVDILTIGFAFHWLNQAHFLQEVARVLQPQGALIIYNMGFVGEMVDNDAYATWHHQVYLQRYPNPERYRTPLAQVLQESAAPLHISETIALNFPQRLSALALRNYLTTQSNVARALEQGEALETIDAWLDDALRALFDNQLEATFRYKGQAFVLTQKEMLDVN